jgi:hypothetical protein
MIIHRPTLDERPALAATVTALPAVEELILDWETKGSSQQSLEFFGAAWTHLAPRLRKLTLRTSIFDLDSFTTVAELEPATSLEAIHVEIRGGSMRNDPRAATAQRSLSALVPVVAKSSSSLKEFTAVVDWRALRGFSVALSELSAIDLPRLVRFTALGLNTYGRSPSLSYIAQPLCSMIQRHASNLEELALNWSSNPNQIEVWLKSGRLPRLRRLVLYNEDRLDFEFDEIETSHPSTTLGQWFSCVPALRDLSIRGLALGEQQLLSLVPALAKCPALHTIELRYYYHLTSKVSDELLRVCPSLAVLKCT